MHKKTKKVYYTMAEAGVLLGKSTEAARKWLLRGGLPRKVGGRWMVSSSQLMALFPDMFQSLA
jgi:hypothetical protein